MNFRAWVRKVSVAFLLLPGALLFAQQPYQVLEHWKIGGTGGWDYMTEDPGAHLLYVTHGPRVEVLDTRTGKPVGAITGLKGTHGVALDDAGRFGYISDGGSNSIVVFDRKTFQTVATVAAGTNPDGIVFDPSSHSVWAFNGRSSNVTVLDAVTNTVAATIAVPGKPEFPVADGRGSVFDNIESLNEIVRFDAKAHTLNATWKLKDCDSPSGLAIDREHRRLFAVCDGGKMAVVNSDTGEQVATAEIGNGPDAARYSPSRGLAFASCGAGTLSVIDTAHGFKRVQELATARGARTMAYDDTTDRAYVVTASFGPAPAATAAQPRPRPAVLPDSFEVLVIGRK